MKDIENLHRKIRHYCLNEFDFWITKYQEARNSQPQTFKHSYEKGDTDIYPRYQALEALLQGVEEVNAETLKSIEEAKVKIIETAISSETIFTRDNHGSAKIAIENERSKFKKFVESILIEELANVPCLFYRRKLTQLESENWKNRLNQLHQIDFSGFWYPVEDIRKNIKEYLVFDEDEVQEINEAKLNELVKSELGENYFEFNEDNTTYELKKETFDIFNLSPETYLIDNDLKLLIYYSHEDFYIIKNESLKEKIKIAYPKLIEHMEKLIKE